MSNLNNWNTNKSNNGKYNSTFHAFVNYYYRYINDLCKYNVCIYNYYILILFYALGNTKKSKWHMEMLCTLKQKNEIEQFVISNI